MKSREHIHFDMKGYDAISYKPHLGAISRQSPLATCTTGERLSVTSTVARQIPTSLVFY